MMAEMKLFKVRQPKSIQSQMQPKQLKQEEKKMKQENATTPKRNVVIEYNTMMKSGKDNWMVNNNYLSEKRIVENGLLNDIEINGNLMNLINKSDRNDICFVDSLNSENKRWKASFKRVVANEKPLVKIQLFIKDKTPEYSHWLLILVQKETLKRLFM